MATAAKAIPEGYHSVTPCLVVPVQDMFWGDRYGKLVDPFGHEWGRATHREDLSPEERAKRAETAMAAMKQG